MQRPLFAYLFLLPGLTLVSACVQETATTPAQDLQTACVESDLIAQCPPGSDPLLGSAAQTACGGFGGVDLTNEQGQVSGRCLGNAQCLVACQFADPCPCGVTAVTRDGVFCTPCNQTAACGNGLCEGGEDPTMCPEDCGRQCSLGQARCAGDTTQEVCDQRGRWEPINCATGEICQDLGDNTVTCRRDDIQVGINPEEDPNQPPERSGRFTPLRNPLPDFGNAARPIPPGDLTQTHAFTLEVPEGIPTTRHHYALSPDGQYLLFNAEALFRARLEDGQVSPVTIETDQDLTAPQIGQMWISPSPDGAHLFAISRDSFLPQNPLLQGTLSPSADTITWTGLGDTRNYFLSRNGNRFQQRAIEPLLSISADATTLSIPLRSPTQQAFWIANPGQPDTLITRPLGPRDDVAPPQALSPNARALAYVDKDRLLHVLDLQEETDIILIEPPDTGGFEEVRFSPTGTHALIRTGQGDEIIELWDLRQGLLLDTFPQAQQQGSTQAVFSKLTWQPDGQSFFIGLRRYDTTGQFLQEFDLPPVDEDWRAWTYHAHHNGTITFTRTANRYIQRGGVQYIPTEVKHYAPAP